MKKPSDFAGNERRMVEMAMFALTLLVADIAQQHIKGVVADDIVIGNRRANQTMAVLTDMLSASMEGSKEEVWEVALSLARDILMLDLARDMFTSLRDTLGREPDETTPDQGDLPPEFRKFIENLDLDLD